MTLALSKIAIKLVTKLEVLETIFMVMGLTVVEDLKYG